MKKTRRSFIQTLSLGGLVWAAPGAKLFTKQEDLDWHHVSDWGVEGKGWTQTKRYYDRLPAKAEGLVRDKVWELSRHSAGMCVHFETDAPSVMVRYQLFQERLSMPHMPATGVSGTDLYARNSAGLYRWLGVSRPTEQEVESTLCQDLSKDVRHFRMYLPLYNGLDNLAIGVPRGSSFVPVPPRSAKPIVFYGTSIMHGACASRPGMAIPALLGRRLDCPTINLGFSGNGRMEPEVGSLLSELKPAAYAIDCAPNMDDKMIDERAVALVRQLRNAHSDTPILLVEDRINTNAHFRPKRADHHRRNHRALRRAHQLLVEEGINDLHYLRGDDLLGHDGDGATDGSHPSDLGMVRYADAYEPALRSMLGIY